MPRLSVKGICLTGALVPAALTLALSFGRVNAQGKSAGLVESASDTPQDRDRRRMRASRMVLPQSSTRRRARLRSRVPL